MRIPNNIDPECIELCNAMNDFGLKTTGSCCGHKKLPFWIAFESKPDIRFQKFIYTACINGLYWECYPTDFNNNKYPLKNWAIKTKLVGIPAYTLAHNLSEEIKKINN